jgi:hypothetical protein
MVTDHPLCADDPSAPNPKFARIVLQKRLRTSGWGHYWWSMIFSENRYPLFGIMLYRVFVGGHRPEEECCFNPFAAAARACSR